MSLFATQTLKPISADTGIDLSSATVHNILYHKPDGTKGDWEGVVNGTVITYQPQDGDIDQSGEWQFQSFVEIAGKQGYGDIVKIKFEDPLD